MRTYQFESVVDEKGTIMLPDEIRKLQKHRIRLIIVDLEAENFNPVDFLNSTTDNYTNIKENEFDITETYRQREKTDERRILFD
ncbi:MAG: hypothetical protein BWK80_03155 [Desulfobacteraceae bacterium IS3]|nr:MAG: hypothetical protein BWK80_03155 [Desulfobacteraceae bacterium IS3]